MATYCCSESLKLLLSVQKYFDIDCNYTKKELSADGNIAVRFFLMAISNRENGENKNHFYRKGMHFEYVMINTIKCNLFFGLGILYTKVFLCVCGTVSSILCLIFWWKTLYCQI